VNYNYFDVKAEDLHFFPPFFEDTFKKERGKASNRGRLLSGASTLVFRKQEIG